MMNPFFVRLQEHGLTSVIHDLKPFQVSHVILYERSGGKSTANINEALKELDNHPLFKKLQGFCLEWRSCRCANNQRISSLQFYEGFMAKYLKCYSCELADKIFCVLDQDHNGYIGWDDITVRAKWVIKEYPNECYDIESFIGTLFLKYLVPECAEVLRDRPKTIKVCMLHLL